MYCFYSRTAVAGSATRNQLRRRTDTNNEQCLGIREQTVVNKSCKLSSDKHRCFRTTAYRYGISERQLNFEVSLRRLIR